MQHREVYPFLDTIMQEINSEPLHRFLGIEMKRYERGVATSSMKVQTHLFKDGVVPSGPLTTLGVLTCKVAALSLIGQGREVVIMEHQQSVLALAQAKMLVVKGRVDHARARLARCIYEIRDDKGELIARGNVLAYTLPREVKETKSPQKAASFEDDDPFHVHTVVEDESVF